MLRRRTVASSDLLGFGSKQTVQAAAPSVRLTIISVKDKKWVRPVAVFYRKDGYLSPAARRFIEILKAKAKEIAREP